MRRRVKRLARVTLKMVSAAVDPLFGPLSGPRILIYHQVGVKFGREMEVSTETFTKQLDWMQTYGEIVDLETAIERRGEPGADKLFVLTFDDGFVDVYENAFPLMKDRGIPFTLYLTTRPIETGQPLDPRYPDARPLTWDQVNEMHARSLATVGAHTHTHLDVRNASPDQIRDELDRSDSAIASNVGHMPKHFAYPWGWWSVAADPLVRERYVSAAVGGGVSVESHRLSRVPVQHADRLFLFRRKLVAGLRLEDRARETLGRYGIR